MWPEDQLVTLVRTRWPSEIAETEEILESAGIPYEIVELFDGEEFEFRVPETALSAARKALGLGG